MTLRPHELPDTEFFRLTNDAEHHRGMRYKTGVNNDKLQFNPSGQCRSGGMYFFSREQLISCFDYIDVESAVYIRRVTFDSKCRIYAEDGKYKCNRFILGERKWFALNDHFSNNQIVQIIMAEPSAIRCVNMMMLRPDNKVYTPEFSKKFKQQLGLIAVTIKGSIIQHIRKPSVNIQLAALTIDMRSYNYIIEPSKRVTEVYRDRLSTDKYNHIFDDLGLSDEYDAVVEFIFE